MSLSDLIEGSINDFTYNAWCVGPRCPHEIVEDHMVITGREFSEFAQSFGKETHLQGIRDAKGVILEDLSEVIAPPEDAKRFMGDWERGVVSGGYSVKERTLEAITRLEEGIDTREDKNGHKIDEKGEVVYDDRCRDCNRSLKDPQG
jgi:hypothetical protein